MKTNSDNDSGDAQVVVTKEVLVLLAPEKIKTIVIMDVPEGPLLCCALEDLTLKPERGSSYVYDGRLFDVERAIEVIGVYKHGSKKSTDEQLLGLLNMLCGQEQTMMRLANIRNIGKEDGTSLSGGIILSAKLSFTADADRLVFLKLRQGRIAPSVDSMVQLARDTLAQNGSGAKKASDQE